MRIFTFTWIIFAGNGKSDALCNHNRAIQYFNESISPKVYFTTFPCESYKKFENGECFDCEFGPINGYSCGRMGYYSDQSKGSGSFYLLTRPEEPFYGMNLEDVYKKVHKIIIWL